MEEGHEWNGVKVYRTQAKEEKMMVVAYEENQKERMVKTRGIR